MGVTICGRFCPDEGAVAGYGNRIRAKSPAKWGVQLAGMIFQTRSSREEYREADQGNCPEGNMGRFPRKMLWKVPFLMQKP